eukprot:4822649-Pyramimonas_sp.AAC.1
MPIGVPWGLLVEAASGRPLRYRRLRERVSVASKRVPRLSKVRKAGPIVCKFVRQALPSAMGYGLGVHGAPPQLVAKMRSVLRSCWYSPGSTTSA